MIWGEEVSPPPGGSETKIVPSTEVPNQSLMNEWLHESLSDIKYYCKDKHKLDQDMVRGGFVIFVNLTKMNGWKVDGEKINELNV